MAMPALRPPDQGLDDRREIGSGIGEEPVDASPLQQREISLCRRFEGGLALWHKGLLAGRETSCGGAAFA
jgi:hypothetical protein